MLCSTREPCLTRDESRLVHVVAPLGREIDLVQHHHVQAGILEPAGDLSEPGQPRGPVSAPQLPLARPRPCAMLKAPIRKSALADAPSRRLGPSIVRIRTARRPSVSRPITYHSEQSARKAAPSRVAILTRLFPRPPVPHRPFPRRRPRARFRTWRSDGADESATARAPAPRHSV